jgi:eukaryotic-like serine/threonine-protein kinase
VWAATDTVLGRGVAIKVLKRVLCDDDVVRERFRREAQLAARLNHRTVVAVYDTISHDDIEAVVQELIDGRTLRDALDQRGRLPLLTTVRVGATIADALDAVHRAGIVHRDVKPGNVLLANDGRILLTDFGIATHGRQDLTRDDVMMGTAKYLSPEQVEGQPATTQADLYSLGVVLYECLAGRAPFSGETEAATALARLRADPIPLRAVRPGVPHRLAGLVAACMARRPEDRPVSAAVVRQALVRMRPAIVEDGPPASRLAERAEGERRLPAWLGRRSRPTTTTHAASTTEATAVTVTERSSNGPSTSDASEPPAATEPRDANTSDDLGAIEPITIDYDVKRPSNRRGRILLAGAGAALLAAAISFLVGTSNRPAGDVGERPPDVTESPTIVVATGNAITTNATPATTAAGSQAEPAIVSTAEFDPPPGDGKENPGLLGKLLDGDPATWWTSLCYDDPQFGAKEGVGVIFELTAPASNHRLEIASPTSHWSASVYVSEVRPDRLRQWGPPVASQRDVTGPTATFDLGNAPGRYVLFWLTRLGPSVSCKLPYGIRISEARIIR